MADWSFSRTPERVVVRQTMPDTRIVREPKRALAEERFARFLASTHRPVEHVRIEPDPEPVTPSGPLPLHRDLTGPLLRDPRPLAEVTDVLIEIIEFG